MYKSDCEVLFVSTYPPETDYIAAYTREMVYYMRQASNISCKVFAVGEREANYSGDVAGRCKKNSRIEHLAAAEHINGLSTDLVVLHHDFNIYGGDDGEYILDMLQNLNLPLGVVCHSVPQTPTLNQVEVMSEICKYGSNCIVMSESAAYNLQKKCKVDEKKIKVMPPLIPMMPKHTREEVKRAYGYEDLVLISSFGSIIPENGIESVIHAISKLKNRHPTLRYLIAGKPCPKATKEEGIKYYKELVNLTRVLDVEDRVIFHSYTPSTRELLTVMTMSDVFLVPSLKVDWLTHYSLAVAMAKGRVVISAPFFYAKETLGNTGILLEEKVKWESVYNSIANVLQNEELKESLEEKAKHLGAYMDTELVCQQYEGMFRRASGLPASRK